MLIPLPSSGPICGEVSVCSCVVFASGGVHVCFGVAVLFVYKSGLFPLLCLYVAVSDEFFAFGVRIAIVVDVGWLV